MISTIESQFQHLNSPLYLATADVKDMYPSIPIDTGLAYFKDFLKIYTNEEFSPWSIEFLSDLLSFVLKNNYFYFSSPTVIPELDTYKKVTKNKLNYFQYYFRQKQGTAMGTPVAVVYANIFMFMLEQKTSKIIINTTSTMHNVNNILLYRRYLDDILMISKTEIDIQYLIDTMNKVKSTIKIIYQISKDKVHFLDLTIYQHVNFFSKLHSIQLKPYAKFGHSLVPYHSFHPQHVKNGIITTELIRLVRNSSVEKDYYEAKNILASKLFHLGYPVEVWMKYSREILYSNRKQYLCPSQETEMEMKISTESTESSSSFIVLPYIKQTANIHKVLQDILNKHAGILPPSLVKDDKIFPPPTITYTNASSISVFFSD